MSFELERVMVNSVEEVITAVGGPSAAARLAGVGRSAVSNWKAFGVIPAEYSEIFRRELKRRGVKFDPDAFSFKRAPAA